MSLLNADSAGMTHGFNRRRLRGLDQPGGLEKKKQIFRRLMPIMILPGHHSTFTHGLTLLLDLGPAMDYLGTD